jgi:hypothetical protein
MRVLALLLLCSACAPKVAPVQLSWAFEAHPTPGEIRVLPVLGVYEAPEVRLEESLAGAWVPWLREAGRRERTEQLLEVPDRVALALPGAVQVAVGETWDGSFRVGRYPVGGRGRLSSALQGRGDLDLALGGVARSVGGAATLVTWIAGLEGDPLTAEAFPGEIVHTRSGSVVIDLADEAYRVRVIVGMALVASDGEVVVRYVDTFEALLSARHGPDRVGRDLAVALAEEVALVWPSDPRLR